MIGTPIAFGLTMIVCFTLFYYYWRIRQLRARLLSAQSAPVQDDFPVEFGIGKNVVETFPTIKACELECTAAEDLQCPICLVEYEEWEVLRQLPFCGHVFHTLCVGAWFEKQTTCPVCRMSMSELTGSFGDSIIADSTRNCRVRPPSSDVTVEVITSDTPSWILVNRCLPLPAPPVPATETTEGNHTCTCTTGILNENGLTQPKMATETPASRECVQLDVAQRRETGSTDFHLVNIPQERRNLCSKCKHFMKRVRTISSGDSLYSMNRPETLHEQGDVQILLFRSSAQSWEGNGLSVSRDNEEVEGGRLNPQETFRLQETSGQNGMTGTHQFTVEADGPVSKDDSNVDSSRNFREEKVSENALQTVLESAQGSFEFQPVITANGELTFRATTQ
ncbi:uncharacterized protein [Physcomitrium patens]|uniref:RING-type domain-containing protein n=1 Tax=Physcomitrium patens TaxID=3218 RepID=A0A7I4BBY1_PHYPA|nr:RING finger protein 150-like isoform X1 [Physcomitrium patens]XP_024400108.1 RING finger protein 150-like isoform X1 [Physcomitrium patens]|eukprot:XP_024400107.1 RING finger protein 150-like isoform X1 [Physcomitrella patens]